MLSMIPSLRARGRQADGVTSAAPAPPATNPCPAVLRDLPRRTLAALGCGRPFSDNEASGDRCGRVKPSYLRGETLTAWVALPADRAVTGWCSLFVLWLAAARGEPTVSARTPGWANAAPTGGTQTWVEDPRVQAVVVDMARALQRGEQDGELLRRLVWLRELLLQWMRPATLRSHARCATAATLLLRLSGWCLALLLTRWQLRRGRRRQGVARRRLVGVPGPLAASIGDLSKPVPPELTLAWLAWQLRLLCGRGDNAACVYLMAGTRSTYVGSTAQRAQTPGAGQLDLPGPRFAQHLRSIMRGDASRSIHKTRRFRGPSWSSSRRPEPWARCARSSACSSAARYPQATPRW